MTIFNLPDLGEGLLEAEIHEWYVKEGDTVQQDQPIVAMETAKAVVDVPAPQAGIIKKIYGQPGTIIRTGAPLIEFVAQETAQSSATVVGKLEEKQEMNLEHLIDTTIATNMTPKATVQTKRLAQRLGVDLNTVIGTGSYGVITAEDVERFVPKHALLTEHSHKEPLKGVRRQMALAMQQSHQQVVPVTIYDDADISNWQTPFDISVRLIQAICFACQEEPSLNAWFNGHERILFDEVHLGLAMDSQDGLFVPVIKNAQALNDFELRQNINVLKTGVIERSLAPEQFQNATITLSNFGKFAGKYASPIIVPPMVAILAVGRLFKTPTIQQEQLSEAVKLPLSLSFDHRAITGGEATRFLGAIITALEKNK
jgi:2-oxoisovalerate dehydrogenase E2 component (dihydrolipoyl transacylase)